MALSNAERQRRCRERRATEAGSLRHEVTSLRHEVAEIKQLILNAYSPSLRHEAGPLRHEEPPVDPPDGVPYPDKEERSPTPPKEEINPPLTLTPLSLIRSLDSEFAEIWPLFPRKVGKGRARKAYRTARKKAAFDTLVAGVRRLAVEHQASETKFIPHPATWLNDERWSDEPRTNGHLDADLPFDRPSKDADIESAYLAIKRELGLPIE